MKQALLAIVVLYPIIFFIWKLRQIGSPVKTVKGYFIAGRQLNTGEFVDSSVAYGLQVAAISLFATWGYSYGFWTLWVPLFWGVGFVLLRHMISRGYFDSFLKDKSSQTLQGFLGTQYKAKSFARIASFVSIFGLSGTAFFEAEFTSTIFSSAIQNPEQSNVIFALFVLIALVYILIGGFRAVVRTDRLQLTLGFIGFSMACSLAFYRITASGYVVTGIVLSFLSLLATCLLLVMYSRLRAINPIAFPRYSVAIMISVLAFSVSFLSIVIKSFTVTQLDSVHVFFVDQQVNGVFSLGGLSLAALFVANTLWQLVDVSNWQRLSALKPDDAHRRNLLDSVQFSGIYSAITWTIAIFFGMALRYMGGGVEDAWTALRDIVLTSFASENINDLLFVFLLVFAMVSIMFSTLDSLISSLSFTSYKDIVLGWLIPDQNATLRSARIWTVVYVMVFLAAYMIVRHFVSRVDDILYTFYAFQLALFPAVLGVLMPWKRNRLAAFGSLIGGAVLCLIPLLGVFPNLNPYNSAALFSVIGGLIIFFILKQFSRFNLS